MTMAVPFRKDRLPNGIVVLTERMPHVKSAAVGLWLRVGSRDEPARRAGISHFIEHMLFKGTERRSAEDIAKAIDAVGGTLDAFTSRESTCFYAKVLGEHLPLAVDLLTDLLLRPRLAPEDIERERQVVLQEIKMVEDDPGDLVHDLFAGALWGDHPLGRPVLGSRETLEAVGREEIRAHLRDFYQPDQVIVAAAGDVDHAHLMGLLGDATQGWEGRALPLNAPAPVSRAAVARDGRESAQVHLCMGVEALPYAAPDRYAMFLLNALLGSSMSSRLFQEVREKRGLAYSIYSYQQAYRDTGLLVVYAGTAPESYRQVLDLVWGECRRVRDEPMDPDEFRRGKEQLKGNLLLGLESTNNRMTRLAKMEIYFGRYFDLDEIIRGIEAVTLEGFRDLTARLFGADAYALTTIGPVPEPAAVA
ncbi:MAG TPA: pitrilysin family protein [Candidatus Sulfotelmatobacter sp.]|nr:pitrilysin family protein [Candidatus Sulfotelmatobacter sp.]